MGRNMRALINGQTLSIDNHKHGDGASIEFKPGIHVHKRMNNDRYAGANIRIPLATDEEMDIEPKGNNKQKLRLKREILNAFKDKSKRTSFVRDMLNELNRQCTFKDESERLRSYLDSANRIAKHFELKQVDNPIVKNTKEIFETLHTDEEGNLYYLLRDIKGNGIYIGDSKDIVENWDNIDWNSF
ncbi:hypothetical protein [Bacteroides fragilis]|jgi:hypothetical protein|uniref:hypothetical protein n=1 Tax=Bacteroides fragilis TaxID=817 RepID=UPI0005161C22|nr:hypothetical protein [Bacteroides fragilis]QCQ52628.1 hypothetical protein EC81_001700 [Bacteroides fragilis]